MTKKEFTDAAEKLGIKAILYNFRENEKLLKEFKEIGIYEK